MRVDVKCGMLGTVTMQHVEDGDMVKKGDTIVEIECMKVLRRVEAPASGKITHKIGLGEFVYEDDVIAQIEVEHGA